MIQIDAFAWILGAVLLLTVPINWLVAAGTAAAFHELCHWVAVKLAGGRMYSLRIGVGGAVMDTGNLEDMQSMLCILAGPAGSLSLLLLCHHFPRLALCAGIQGLFNLLPLSSLDGGRALQCCLRMVCPDKGEKIGRILEAATLVTIASAGLWAAENVLLRCLTAVLFCVLLLRMISGKKPCKPCQIKVQ